MNIGGIEVSEPHEVTLVLPRGDQHIVFKARAILSYDEFYALCPKPIPPTMVVRGGKKKLDDSNKDYIAALVIHNARLEAWTCIKSLEPSDIKWTTVKLDSPGTWEGWIAEFKAANFTYTEINRIIGIVLEANCLDEKKLEWARESFVQGQQTSPSN